MRGDRGLPDRDADKPVEVFYTGFGESSIDLSVRFWIDLRDEKTSFLAARSRAVVALKQAFDRAGVSIPFPIRTLDFGIQGGDDLATMLDRARKANGSGAGASTDA